MTREQMIDEATRREFARFDAQGEGFMGCIKWAKWCIEDSEYTFASFAKGFARRIRIEFRKLAENELA